MIVETLKIFTQKTEKKRNLHTKICLSACVRFSTLNANRRRTRIHKLCATESAFDQYIHTHTLQTEKCHIKIENTLF